MQSGSTLTIRRLKVTPIVAACSLAVLLSAPPAFGTDPVQNGTDPSEHPRTQQDADSQISSLIIRVEQALRDKQDSTSAFTIASQLLASAMALQQYASPAGNRMLTNFPAELRTRAAEEKAAGHADKALRFSIFAEASSTVLQSPGEGNQLPAGNEDWSAGSAPPAQTADTTHASRPKDAETTTDASAGEVSDTQARQIRATGRRQHGAAAVGATAAGFGSRQRHCHGARRRPDCARR